MLESEIKTQLENVFKKLEKTVLLTTKFSSHPDQTKLDEMLNEISSCSSKIKIRKNSETSPIPSFSVGSENKEAKIHFNGIPGGHEFSSLVLAILNVDGKGKLPDSAIGSRIQSIAGPIKLQTYISLSCENCPDVVQALNQIALIHPDFHHTMIDGAYVQDELTQLGIQGVPSVMSSNKLISSGKTSFIELIEKIETHFGKSNNSASEKISKDLGMFDVAIIGGGPAGAAAAIYIARKGFKTALIAEKFGGQVQDTKGIENLISVPYIEGPELAAHLAKHVQSYPIEILEHRRVEKIEKGPLKKIQLSGGEYLNAPSIIVTTGAKWRELGVPGEKEYIGRGVAFCPHCDGPYYKGKKVAVVGGGNSGIEAAIDLAGIVQHVVVLEFANSLKADQILIDKIHSLPNVSVVCDAKTEQIIGDGSKVIGLEYQDRSTSKIEKIDLDGVFVQIGLLPNSGFLKETLDLTKFGEIIVDNKGRTSEPGIYAAGDVTTTPFKQIIIAMGEGAKAALTLFEDRMRSER